MIRRVLGKDVLDDEAQVETALPAAPDPFWPRYHGIKSGRSFVLSPIDERTPEQIAEDDERAWLDEASFQNEHAAHCSTAIPASINN